MFQNKKFLLFTFLVFFWWAFLAKVDFSSSDIFHDSDQDGLTDEEEYMYGTDLKNPDTDQDGYRDGVEVESGYDPLKPSPGDKVFYGKQKKENQSKKEELVSEEENLTDQFFKEMTTKKSEELGLMSDFYSNPEDFNENEEKINSLKEASLTSGEVQELLQETLQKPDLSREMELVDESEIVVLDKTSDEEKEKKQIEKYFTQVLYVMSVNKPFFIEDQALLPQVGVDYVSQISNSIQNQQTEQITELKEKAQKTYQEFLEIETPYKTKEIHRKIISLIKYLSEEINEDKIANPDDPMAMALYVGKLQAVLIEAESMKGEMDEIIKEYEIELFDQEEE